MESELLLLSVYMNILTFSFLNNCSYLILFMGMTVEETKLPIKCQYAWEPYGKLMYLSTAFCLPIQL